MLLNVRQCRGQPCYKELSGFRGQLCQGLKNPRLTMCISFFRDPCFLFLFSVFTILGVGYGFIFC